jgi:hypothetical protein
LTGVAHTQVAGSPAKQTKRKARVVPSRQQQAPDELNARSHSSGLERSDKNKRRCLEMKSKLMSLRKVYGGTPVGTESRCDTCSNARIIEGYAESERLVFCDAMYPATRIPFNVRQCSMYEDRRLPAFCQMQKIAWEIRSKSAGSVAGFVTVPDPDPQNEEEIEQPEDVPAAAKTK